MPKPKKNEKSPETAPAVRVEVVTELSALEALSSGGPLVADVILHGKSVRLLGRRLTPGESKEVKAILERALPPLVPPEKEGDPERYDLREPGFLQQRERDVRLARALAVWTAFPIFSEGWRAATPDAPPGPPKPETILDFLDSRQVEDDLLDGLFRLITRRVAWLAEDEGLAHRVGFT